MKNQPKTVIDTLLERLRDQAKRFNPSLETAPVAVLWTDERRDWEGVMTQLKSALPELCALGEYQPHERTGPGAWLRMVADGLAGDLLQGWCRSSICQAWPMPACVPICARSRMTTR